MTNPKKAIPSLDWASLSELIKARGGIRNVTLLAVAPRFAPPRIMSGVTPGIHPEPFEFFGGGLSDSPKRMYYARATRATSRSPYFQAALQDYPIQ
jgi:hypothetical protein